MTFHQGCDLAVVATADETNTSSFCFLVAWISFAVTASGLVHFQPLSLSPGERLETAEVVRKRKFTSAGGKYDLHFN